MGAIQSACPTRRSPGIQQAAQKKADTPATSQLPSRSTKQFGGASLSKTAEPFIPVAESPSPSNVPATRITKQQARQKAAAPAAVPHVPNPNDPEWFQYLEKKAVEKFGPRPGEQKSNDQKKVTGGAPQGSGGANFVLHTSEYLKLLKDGEHKQGGDKNKAPTGDKMFSKDNLKNDLAAALDSIIKTQQSQPGRKKQDLKAQKGAGSADVLSRIAQMMNKDGAEEKEAEADAIGVQDDIFSERQNRDEDLAVPCYWSDDDQAPKAVKRASAHHAVGKVPGVRPRRYVTQNLDDNLDHQIAILLLHLRRLSDRQRIIEPEVSAKRRLVVGLKEVARSVRQGKVKCVVVAPDIEELGTTAAGVDERVNEIVVACYKQDTPVIFALSRTRIGRALGKSLRMSALAILDVTGTSDLYDKILEESFAQRVAWLEKQPKPEAPWKAKAAAKAAIKAGRAG